MKRKSLIGLLLVFVLVLGVFSACASSPDSSDDSDSGEAVTLIVGATPVPHAEILEQVVSDLEAEGYTLQITEFTDYVLPNTALSDGDLAANYFQHLPYLDQFNEENGTDLVGVASIHYEPLALYPGKSTSLDEVKEGTEILVPNDATNEARALLLLEANGLVVLKEGIGLEATVLDITEYPKGKLTITEIDAAQIAKSLQDVDFAVINGNYALEAGLNAATDALVKEEKDSLAAETFANYVVVRAGDKDKPEVQALVKALQSEKIRAFIEETYEGAVVPSF
ncbi:MAG: MetQ/NlpA family ABC transporter substrate-binding protein [Clostridiales Family XIII bacterium]|jgi:D-methionine transport system substrate-binding protein|nr:MetQ/NlpA family ABC transporter substrate-binding protein [Clostridiales Family XIII bacterium]